MTKVNKNINLRQFLITRVTSLKKVFEIGLHETAIFANCTSKDVLLLLFNMVLIIICLINNIIIIYYILLVVQLTFYLLEHVDLAKINIYSKSIMPMVVTMGGTLPILKGIGVVALGSLLYYNWESISTCLSGAYDYVKTYFTGSPPPSKGSPVEVGVLTSATGDRVANTVANTVVTEVVASVSTEVIVTSHVAQAAVSETTALATAVDVTNGVVQSVPRCISSARVSAGVHTVPRIHSSAELIDMPKHFQWYVDVQALNNSVSLFITKPSELELSHMYTGWFYKYMSPIVDSIINVSTNTSSINKATDINGRTPITEILKYSSYIYDKRNSVERNELLNRLHWLMNEWIKHNNHNQLDFTNVKTINKLLDTHSSKLSLNDFFEQIIRKYLRNPDNSHLCEPENFFTTLDLSIRILFKESVKFRQDIRSLRDEWEVTASTKTLNEYIQEDFHDVFIDFVNKK
jgi:hypothetical protein